MSVLRSRSSTSSSKVFLLSGLSGDERRDLAKKITLLGGIYFDIEDFKAHCTHVVCGKLSRSEKFLGACATGKWVLHPEYIKQSMVAKDWLDEEQFEWCDENISKKFIGVIPFELAYATRRWRFMLGNQNGAFAGWKVAVVAGAKRSKVIKRLLISGGAEVFNMKIPIKSPEKVANTIGYIFVSEQNIGSVAHLLEYGVLCIKPEFIGDYLIKDPPADPMDYLVQANFTEAPIQTSSQGDSHSFLMASQLDPPSSQPSSLGDVDIKYSPAKSPQVPVEQNGHVYIKQEPSFASSQENHSSKSFLSPSKSKSSASFTLSSQNSEPASPLSSLNSKKSSKTASSVTDTQILSEPGPSGAASQTGAQNIHSYLETEPNLQLSQLENQSASVVRKVTPSLTRTSSVASPALDELSNVKKSAGSDSNSSYENISNSRFKKSRDSSKVKRSKETSSDGDKQESNNDGVHIVVKSKNEIKANLSRSSSDVTGDKVILRTSKRLQTSKSEPVWKDLIPKRRSSVEHVEDHKSIDESSEMINSEVSQTVVKTEQAGAKTEQAGAKTEQAGAETDHTDATSVISNDKKSRIDFIDLTYGNEGQDLNEKKTSKNSAATEMKTESSKLLESKVRECGIQERWQERRQADATLPHTSVSTIKKKRSRQDADLQSILKEVKRQKVSQCEWRPTVFALGPNHESQHDIMVMPMTLTEIIHSSFDEKLSRQAAVLDELSSKITKKYIPQPKTLHALMVNLLLGAKTELEANKAYQVLMKILHLHPPMSPAVQDVYRRSLCIVDASGMDEGETAQGADWILIKDCISNLISGCLSTGSISFQIERNSGLLLKYLTSLIEQDLQNFMLHVHQRQEQGMRPLLVRVLWSPSYHIVLNSRCRELLDLMKEVLIALRTNGQVKQKENLLKILRIIVWMVAMATECCRMSEGGCSEGLMGLQCDKTGTFIHEIARRITIADVTDPAILQVIFSSLQFPWQCVGVSQQLLNNMDDYLLADEQVRDMNRITLSHIVSRYFFLLPKFNIRAEHVQRCPASPAKRQRDLISARSKSKECLVESNSHSAENIAKLSGKVNKKNFKGETPLHTACIKDDVNKLKQLLKIPGVDVNMKDNAGWTPLHEACNHGSIQCVQELLKFVPAKTMEHYFKKDNIMLRRVDLLAKTDEGITPLHDAVLNGRLEVCRMLLQHGGHKLLSAVTCLSYTPLQLAESEDMYAVLSSYLPPPRRQSDSQEMSFSQDSLMSVDETRTELPPDHLYEEVTTNRNTRIFPDKHALLAFIYLITCLLKNYIKATDAEAVREKIKDKLNNRSAISKSRQKLQTNFDSQNKESSQEIDGVPFSSQESNPTTPTERLTFGFTESGETSDKENIRLPFGSRNKISNAMEMSSYSAGHTMTSHGMSSTIGTHCTFNGIANQRLSEIKTELVETRVNKEYVRALKRDLRVLRNLSKYVDMFRSHLQKICAEDDTELIETELFEISVMVDNFLS